MIHRSSLIRLKYTTFPSTINDGGCLWDRNGIRGELTDLNNPHATTNVLLYIHGQLICRSPFFSLGFEAAPASISFVGSNGRKLRIEGRWGCRWSANGRSSSEELSLLQACSVVKILLGSCPGWMLLRNVENGEGKVGNDCVRNLVKKPSGLVGGFVCLGVGGVDI